MNSANILMTRSFLANSSCSSRIFAFHAAPGNPDGIPKFYNKLPYQPFLVVMALYLYKGISINI